MACQVPTNLARRRRTRRSAIGAVHATAITWPARTLRLKPISGSGCVPDETGFLGVAQGSLGFLVQVPEASHPFLPQGSKRMYQLIHKRGSRLRRGGRQHDKFQGLEPRQPRYTYF